MRNPSRIITWLKKLTVTAWEWLGTAGAMSTWSYRPPSTWEVQETIRRLRELKRPALAGLRVRTATTDRARCCVNDALPCSC
jgi:hypothetical protein